MSSGFLLADALSSVLRKPYHKADVAISVNYLVEGITIGPYRVMLKRDFDTACWIPPVGKRTSHSIYYGDRMVARVMERFVNIHELSMPDTTVFEDDIKNRIAIEKEAIKTATEARAKASPAQQKRIKIPIPHPMSLKSRVLDCQLLWLKKTADEDLWALFGDWLHKAIMSYGRHERSHARHTPQDLNQVNRDLRTFGIPFHYFNLFEDARIEHLDRQDQGMQFEWMMFEDLAPSNHPAKMFLRCIQLEGEPDNLALEDESPFKGDPARTVSAVADSVQVYYKRACECPTAEHLYPILAEFLEEFKEDLPPPSSGKSGPEAGAGSGSSSSGTGSKGGGAPSGSGSEGEGGEDDEAEDTGAGERAGDLSTAADAAEQGDDFFNDFDKDSSIVGGTDAEGKAAEAAAKDELKPKVPAPTGRGTDGAQGTPESIEPIGKGGRASEVSFLARQAGQLDDVFRARVDNLTAMLMRMFKTHSLPSAQESPAQRMSSRHLARGDIRFLHKRVFGGKGKRKYSIIFDCSGSMGGRPSREGKLLLLALNNLAKRGYLEGSLILSGFVGGSPAWLNYTFPVKDEIILRIDTSHCSEGLQTALADNLKSIKDMDDVFVMTDACICDTPINREIFARQRIWPVGLYVGSKEAASEMEKHFPQNIIRDTIEQVVEAMLTRNRRTVS